MSSDRGRPAPDVVLLERLASEAWPAAERQALGPWEIRSDRCPSSKRVNSVLTAGPYPARSDWLETALAYYAERAKPCRFQVSEASPDDLDGRLAEAGFRKETACRVWTAPLPLLPEAETGAGAPDIRVLSEPSPKWLHDWSSLEQHPGESRDAYADIVRRIRAPAAYAVALTADGETAGVASAVAQGEWLGLFNLVVAPWHRRRGTGAALVLALARWGVRRRCRAAYLQVLTDNEPAQRLYRKLGFRPAYAYHYRELRF